MGKTTKRLYDWRNGASPFFADGVYTHDNIFNATVGIIKSISVYNSNAGVSTLTLSILDSSTSAITIYDKHALATDTKHEFLKGDNSTVLILEEGDKIQMLSDVADPIVTISVLQQDRT